jgi:hypothetical protein
MKADRVECRSDYDYIGRPLAFYWQGQRLEVAKVMDQTRTPSHYRFHVQTQENDSFKLEYDIKTECWSVHKL